MDDSIIVKQSLKGNIAYIFGALAMSLLALFFVFVEFRSLERGLNLFFIINVVYILYKLLLAFGFVFFGFCSLYYIKRAISGKNILVVDENGITDNSSLLAFGFIPWKDIDNIYIDSSVGNEFIELVLNNEEYYRKKLHGLKKLAVSANKKMKHQMVCITLNSTGISPKTLLPKIHKMFEQSKSKSNM